MPFPASERWRAGFEPLFHERCQPFRQQPQGVAENRRSFAGLDDPQIDKLVVQSPVFLLVGWRRSHEQGSRDVLKTKDGLEIRTTWGEMAWQLGGKKAYASLAAT